MGEKYDQLRVEFERGIAIAIDPSNDSAIQSGGKATTTLSSSWLHQHCQVCLHTFRLGDEVYITEGGTVLHDSVLLPCRGGATAHNLASQEISDFFAGLDEAWPPPEDIPVVRLEAGHKLLASADKGFRRHTCAVCGHTLRLHDHVVICPCNPNEPLCETAVHRDPVHGLHCLEAWNPGANKQQHCPITLRKLNE